ncbi:MAG: hypothetical protein H6747_01120 [Deltaproteobacteria bacterium]|nr:hypothetical protein [Deltaproteobacteria bacterium]
MEAVKVWETTTASDRTAFADRWERIGVAIDDFDFTAASAQMAEDPSRF